MQRGQKYIIYESAYYKAYETKLDEQKFLLVEYKYSSHFESLEVY